MRTVSTCSSVTGVVSEPSTVAKSSPCTSSCFCGQPQAPWLRADRSSHQPKQRQRWQASVSRPIFEIHEILRAFAATSRLRESIPACLLPERALSFLVRRPWAMRLSSRSANGGLAPVEKPPRRRPGSGSRSRGSATRPKAWCQKGPRAGRSPFGNTSPTALPEWRSFSLASRFLEVVHVARGELDPNAVNTLGGGEHRTLGTGVRLETSVGEQHRVVADVGNEGFASPARRSNQRSPAFHFRLGAPGATAASLFAREQPDLLAHAQPFFFFP